MATRADASLLRIFCHHQHDPLRHHLLENGAIEERILPIDCLAQAEAITLINSVRGEMEARFF